MPRIRDILPAILAQRSSVIDHALSAALAHADPDEVGALGDAMLDRAKANGVESLITEYQRLPEPLQHKLVDRAEAYATSIRRAAGRKGAEGATNALTIIEKSASTRLAYLVTSMCRHTDPRVREQAGRCIVSMANRAASSPEPGQPPHLDTLSTHFLLEAVEQAVVLYSRHDKTDLLGAMLWLLPRPMPEARAALSQPDHAAVQPMISLLQNKPGICGRRALL